MVPTFTSLPFDKGGAQLCPCGIATATPQAFTMASEPGDINQTPSSPRRPDHRRRRYAPQPSPNPSD